MIQNMAFTCLALPTSRFPFHLHRSEGQRFSASSQDSLLYRLYIQKLVPYDANTIMIRDTTPKSGMKKGWKEIT